ncbi:effector-associated constant component EACC1 [Streptomyces sp. NPDC002676]
MELSLTVAGDGSPDELTSLHRWLIQDPDVTHHATLELGERVTDGPTGEMSGALEVLNIVLGDAVALGNLLVAIGTWRDTRRRAPEVRIQRAGTTVTVTVSGDDPETARAVIAALSDAPEGPDASGRP